jgi:flagellar motor switch protein FliN/FliY
MMAEEKDLELSEMDNMEALLPAEDEDGAEGDSGLPAMGMDGLPEVGELPRSAKDLEAVYDIPVQVSAVLGKTTMQVSQLLKLGRGAVIELDRKVGEAIDIYVNNRLVARGEVVVVEDRLGVTMTEIIKTEKVS